MLSFAVSVFKSLEEDKHYNQLVCGSSGKTHLLYEVFIREEIVILKKLLRCGRIN